MRHTRFIVVLIVSLLGLLMACSNPESKTPTLLGDATTPFTAEENQVAYGEVAADDGAYIDPKKYLNPKAKNFDPSKKVSPEYLVTNDKERYLKTVPKGVREILSNLPGNKATAFDSAKDYNCKKTNCEPAGTQYADNGPFTPTAALRRAASSEGGGLKVGTGDLLVRACDKNGFRYSIRFSKKWEVVRHVWKISQISPSFTLCDPTAPYKEFKRVPDPLHPEYEKYFSKKQDEEWGK